ncbi:MAG: GyrI-like domain-containing protein, partial [Gammaproteobacteria bacterium]|nr:GyrI-like domain-containing protein [Gammaproteobacteria bacterium]
RGRAREQSARLRRHMKEPTIETIAQARLVGFGARMTLRSDATVALWQRLMPRRNEIRNRTTNDYVSMRVYEPMPVAQMFAPDTEFEKWAAIEVADHGSVPDGMQTYTLEGGRYAVFLHEGPASRFPETMRYIFGEWLPQSGFTLDAREQFERLPEGYSPADENAYEHVYIPVVSR